MSDAKMSEKHKQKICIAEKFEACNAWMSSSNCFSVSTVPFPKNRKKYINISKCYHKCVIL